MNNFSIENRYLSCKELAEYLSVSEQTVYYWVCQRGNFPSYKFGRSRRFILDEVVQYFRNN